MIGSNRIAATFAALFFAEVPKRSFSTCPVILLDRPAQKWNSHLGYRAWSGRAGYGTNHAIAEAMAWLGLIPAGAAGAMRIGPRPRISFSRAWRGYVLN
jgi:hypothetical protein